MSVQTSDSRKQFEGNNSTITEYCFHFYFFDATDLVVVVTNENGVETKLLLNTDYTVFGAGDLNGGHILTTNAIPSSSLVTIYREVEATQLSAYPENGRFPSASHERALDRLTMLCQQVIRRFARSFSVRESDDELDTVAAVPNTVLGFDGNKQGRTYTLSDLQSFLSLTPVPVIGMPTMTFADAGERALAKAAFTGQLGTQRDTGQLYISTATNVAGAWTIFSLATGSITASMLATTLDLSSKTLTYPSGQIPTTALANAAVTSAKIATNTVSYQNIAAHVTDFLGSTRNLRITRPDAASVAIDLDAIAILNTSGTGVARFLSPSTTTVSFSNPNGVNGLDTGTETSNIWYHIWAISDGTNLKGLFSTSATTPVLPSGYTYNYYLGAIFNDAGLNLIPIYQIGNRVTTTISSPLSALTGQTSYTPLGLASSVPTTAKYAIGNVGTSSNVGNTAIVVAADSGGFARSGGFAQAFSGVPMDSLTACIPFRVPLLTTQQIYWKSNSTASNAFYVQITGWEFN